jgi:excisionase family DNA binding protein
MVDTERLLTVGEASERLHLSESMVWALLARGDIESLTIGRSRRVSVSALSRFIEQREAASRIVNNRKAAPGVEPGTAEEGGTRDAAPSG